MTRNEAITYAERWTEAWNRRDLDAVLAHFDDDVVFTSPKAADMIGVPTVRGKERLREYWRIALARIETLRFILDRVLWDDESSELAILYDREVNGRRDKAAECLRFGASGRVTHGEVLYGVIP